MSYDQRQHFKDSTAEYPLPKTGSKIAFLNDRPMHDRSGKAKEPHAPRYEDHEVFQTKKDIATSIPYEIKNNLVYDYHAKVDPHENKEH